MEQPRKKSKNGNGNEPFHHFFSKVGEDIIVEILSYLTSPKDINFFGQCCKRLHTIANLPKVWRTLSSQKYDVDWYEHLLRLAVGQNDLRDCNWKWFYSVIFSNGETWTKANLELLCVMKRCVLPLTSPDFLRIYCYVFFDDTPTSPKQVLTLIPENCKLNDEHILEITFKPAQKETIYFWYGEGRKHSKIELAMVNRRSPENHVVIVSERPFRYNPKLNDGYHFGNKGSFRVRITTLSISQLEVVAKYLNIGISSFYVQRSLSNRGHSDRFLSTEQTSALLREQSNPIRIVDVGQVVEIEYRVHIDKLYRAAFPTQPKKKDEEI